MQISNHVITLFGLHLIITSHCKYICEQRGFRAIDLAGFVHKRIVELLESGSKEALLRAASEGGDTKTVKKLLEEGVNVKSCDLVSNINYRVNLF